MDSFKPPADDADAGIRELTDLLRGSTGRDQEALSVVEDHGPEQQSHAFALKRPRQPARHEVDVGRPLELLDRRRLLVADVVRRAEDRGGDRAADVDVETAVAAPLVRTREAGHPGRHAADEGAPLPDALHPPLAPPLGVLPQATATHRNNGQGHCARRTIAPAHDCC